MACVLLLSSDAGFVGIELFSPEQEPVLSVIRLVSSGQLGGGLFKGVEDGAFLSCVLHSHDVFIASSLHCGAPRDREELRHVGAGVVSCRVPCPGEVVSEMLISLLPTPLVDGDLAIVGRIFDGMDVISKIAGQKVDSSGVFYAPVCISSASVSRRLLSKPKMVPLFCSCQNDSCSVHAVSNNGLPT